MSDTTDAKLESFQAGGDQSNVPESLVTTDETDSIGGYRYACKLVIIIDLFFKIKII